MTLNEAIEHCDEIIEENKECSNCIDEHRELKAWLEELAHRRTYCLQVKSQFGEFV